MSTFQQRFNRAMERVGGRYKLTALLQHRIRELVRRDRPLVEVDTPDYVEIALAEVLEGKLEMGPQIKDPEDTEVLGDAPDLDSDQEAGKDRISIPL